MTAPNFDNLLAVLRREAPSRPTLFEFFLNERLYRALAGYEPDMTQPHAWQRLMLAAYHRAGYDYVTVQGSDFRFAAGAQHRAASVSMNEGSVLASRADLEAYAFEDPAAFDYSRLDVLGAELPAGMKLVVHGPSGVLENTVRLVGYEALCLLCYDEPELARDIFAAVGSRLLTYYEICAPHPAVGACISNDDWGHKTQTMLPPAVMREFCFPWHQRIVAAIHAAGKPAILHSCGARHEIMEDIIEVMRFDGLHSYEDLIQPVEEAWEQWGERIAILGGIDVDFLCREPLERIRERVAAMLQRTASRGGWAVGSGNSIPYYVPDEAYHAMLQPALAGR
ncbi:MAG: hypothetical protein IT204_11625 [Fimbriimonadaceae bacterium]|nr:hypothetical protein [Fimbriimonadaceae bacterium]